MATNQTGTWTDARVDQLKTLHGTGLSASQIAKAMGHITRNAVIGKAMRLGLGPIGGGKASAPARPKAVRAPAKLRAFAPPPIRVTQNGMTFAEPVAREPRAVVAEDVSGPGSRTVLTIGRFECRWPIGDPLGDDFTLCGARGCVGPYCVSHAAVARVPTPPKARTGNELARSLRRYI